MLQRCFPRLTAAAVVGLCAATAFAAPDATIRVRGAARLEASASANGSGTQVSGTLRDDAGRAVRAARVRVRWIVAGGARLLPRPASCSENARAAAPSESDEALAETDEAGRFCLRWPLELPDGELAISFEDERGLLDPLSKTVELDRKPPVSLAFSPPPTVFSAETNAATVVLEARGPGERTLSATLVRLAWVRVDKSVTVLTHGELRPGEALRLTFSPASLGAPGAGELVASAELAGRKLEARAPVSLTARVALEHESELPARADGSAELSVNVRSAFGPVASGSVEATAHGRTIGIAAVSAGRAELELHAPPEPGVVEVSLRYLSAAPWWLPGDEHVISLLVARPSPARWAPWALGLLAIGGYLLAGWRRPRRRELPKPELAQLPPDRASIEWVAAPRAGGGWAGRVTDAHDAAPIEGARVSVLAAQARLAHTLTDSKGDFQFTLPAGTDTREARIVVEATWHAELQKALPPPGKLAVSLLTRRRALLGSLIEWAQRQGRPYSAEREPTPGEVRGVADEAAQLAVAQWAHGVEEAAFGPTPVDADREAGVRATEPKPDFTPRGG
ncbi:MAG: carboxypeptidase-like regulatory domain-containing protein [Polyangiaceae bacterium]